MLRIVKSFLTIAVVAAIAVGATGAYFSDQETISGMNIATGTLSITDTSASWTKTVVFNDLKPGDTIRKWVTMTNDGTLPVDYLRVGTANVFDPDRLLGQIRVSVYAQVTGYDQGIYTPDWGNGQPVDPWLSDIDVLGTAVYRDATAAKMLQPGESITMPIDFKVPSTLGDSWQGKSATFDLTFDAEQSHTGTSYF
jgi:predicted ribosomally synthesized peptide with SipW-like signal peptide